MAASVSPVHGSQALDSPAAIGGGAFGGIGSPRELIGHGLDEPGAHDVLDRCVDLGVLIVDTAHGYAGGASHRMIGSWLAADAARRDRVAVVDKVGRVDHHGRSGVDLSGETVLAQAAAGRRRLGVDAVDVIMTHGCDAGTAPAETAAALASLLGDGRARHWGLSNVSHSELVDWLLAAERAGMPDPVFVENRYSLLTRDDEAEVLPLCRERGIGYLAYSPLAGGVLTGKYRPGQAPPPGSRLALRPAVADRLDGRTQAVLDVLAGRAHDLGLSMAALALAWVLAQPGIRPIVGVSKPQHLDALAAALALELSRSDVDALTASVSPG